MWANGLYAIGQRRTAGVPKDLAGDSATRAKVPRAGLSERRNTNYSLATFAPPAHFRRTMTLAPTHVHTTAPNSTAEGSGIDVMT